MPQIYQMAKNAVHSIWADLKKEKSYTKGALWCTAFVVSGCGLATIIALGTAFFALAALAIPFSAPSAGLAYIVIASFTIPAGLFLTVITHQTFKHTYHHFSASILIEDNVKTF